MDDLFNAMLSGNDKKEAGSGDDAPDLGGMLQNLMGGDAEGGVAGLLGGLMDGGDGENPIADTVTNLLADRLGLSPDIARTVVSFVLEKVTGGNASDTKGLDLQNLMGNLDVSSLQQSGLSQELADKTGLDPETAADSLQKVMQLFGGGEGQGGGSAGFGGLGDLFGG